MWTVVIILIIIGLIINFIDKKQINKPRVNFKYKDYPHMKPIRIVTKDKGFWSIVIMWNYWGRRWEISKDFVYELNGVKYVIPKGFTHLMVSISVINFFFTFLSPVMFYC